MIYLKSTQLLSVSLAVIIPSLLMPSPGFSQVASSTSFFVPGLERAPGGQCASTNFRMEICVGGGVVLQPLFSSNFKFLGGFNTVSDTPITGHPWLSGASPMYGPFLGGTTHTLHGHELNLGAATTATVGGHTATVLSRARDHMKVRLPGQTIPGWQPVTATNPGGTAHLIKGIGILPMVEKAHAIEVGQPFRITYRGTQGDVVVIAVTTAKMAAPVPFPPYLHALEVDFGSLVDHIGPLGVTDPSGELHIDIPGIFFHRPIHVQMISLPVSNPGYAPGCFTNTITL